MRKLTIAVVFPLKESKTEFKKPAIGLWLTTFKISSTCHKKTEKVIILPEGP